MALNAHWFWTGYKIVRINDYICTAFYEYVTWIYSCITAYISQSNNLEAQFRSLNAPLHVAKQSFEEVSELMELDYGHTVTNSNNTLW